MTLNPQVPTKTLVMGYLLFPTDVKMVDKPTIIHYILTRSLNFCTLPTNHCITSDLTREDKTKMSISMSLYIIEYSISSPVV